ncbi:pyrimidine reductase family protein [Rhodococcus sp. BL-253-APC-6A1W]|uniref:pyrimidine reductase family protein n=2 Tax=unclassified Rhodococcus (in: high G+C Gram-positive bacteria) TaxID=192944 RepID=UPI00146D98C4|nr:pyrimidine reductase family protein [Rhodococcus sp. BL-253-APC-6A1W]NMD95859.1 pyrimidine reductase family protein [Rhodococcus sp. BL-253-APC-6A1W]
MHQLDDPASPTDVGDDRLRQLYAYPEGLERPWMRVNFVSSLDGAVAVEGRSGALGTPSDKKVFGLLRELADVILVGAGTVRTENYGGARTSETLRARREADGLDAVPPIAVVTTSCYFPSDLRLFTDTAVPPIVFTSASAPVANRRRAEDAGADVRVIADDTIDGAALLAAVTKAGWTRVLCEGGPQLFGSMIEADIVDDLCLTFAPVLAAGAAGRIASTPTPVVTPMRRTHLVADDDGTLLTRWIRDDREGASRGR